MKYLDPSERVLFPVILSVRADTAELLKEMANEMDVSMDDVLSAIAEDSVCDLAGSRVFLNDVVIPDRCSTEDLLKRLE